MTANDRIPTSRLVAGIGVFVILGTPLVGYLWYTLNDVLAGVFQPIRILIAVPVAILFYLLLRLMASRVNAWEGQRRQAVHEER